ncbi:MAG: hypothetical protein QOD30_2033 [Actinomycetota bacterium]|nr:hypothetical protein [Actinomycetota bacterium]
MRRLFTSAGSGLTRSERAWAVRSGRCVRVQQGIYAEGPEPASPLDRARGAVLASRREARGALAGVLHGLDAVQLDDRPTRRTALAPERVVHVHGTRCGDGLQTMIDLASILDDDVWEQALESALRKRLLTIADLEAAPPWTPGAPRIRRVLGGRPPGAPPTESLLETLALQLARPILGEPLRQLVVRSVHGTFIARIDLSWPDREIFFELDGQGHKDQPVYDATRETAVVAATGWLPGRFTWSEITRIPVSTQRRFAELRAQSDRRCAV